MTHRRFRTAAIILVALALGACASPPPVGSAGSNMVSYNCPEQDPAQPNCKVPR